MKSKQFLRGSSAVGAIVMAASLLASSLAFAGDTAPAKPGAATPELGLGQNYFAVPNSFEKASTPGLLDFDSDDPKAGQPDAVASKLKSLLQLNDNMRLTPTTHSDITAKDEAISKEKAAYLKLQIDW